MADLQILSTEVNTDPLGRGYAAMTDAQVVASLLEANRSRVKTAMQAKEILEAIVPAELMALSEANRLFVMSFIGASDSHDPRNGSLAHSVFTTIFPNSQTLSALGAARTESISRADEIGVGNVTEKEVARVRAG